MVDKTKTVNAVRGCTKASEGCEHCYAIRVCDRLFHCHGGPTGGPFSGLVLHNPGGELRWTGKVALDEGALLAPLHWRRPRVIFWNSLGDTFHESVSDEWRNRMFAVMALTPQHTHLVLTKRAKEMAAYLSGVCESDNWSEHLQEIVLRDHGLPMLEEAPFTNVYLGITVENQARADERLPVLAELAAAGWNTFVSLEPLLGPVDLRLPPTFCPQFCAIPSTQQQQERVIDCAYRTNVTGKCQRRQCPYPYFGRGLSWVILGGESGPGARPMRPEWVRSVRDQCAAAAGVPFFFKQWGEWLPESQGRQWKLSVRVGKRAAGHLLDGVEHRAVPWRTPRSEAEKKGRAWDTIPLNMAAGTPSAEGFTTYREARDALLKTADPPKSDVSGKRRISGESGRR